ncbi:hypothetical protein M9H77_04379 [Catharanthus roseus]|uniref:Uncharacterized protein n=1 Tax=Catharanthus roseus TaxID=4058 RepID=A0ACC0CDX9_CATRO|nr:hypothetical protein M9H77_04379 [Catharanthus roseus]
MPLVFGCEQRAHTATPASLPPPATTLPPFSSVNFRLRTVDCRRLAALGALQFFIRSPPLRFIFWRLQAFSILEELRHLHTVAKRPSIGSSFLLRFRTCLDVLNA